MCLYMATEGDVDTSRTHVQTYVPAYQKDQWAAEAESMDMSLSEFVRSMVQAGRSELSLDETAMPNRDIKKAPADPSSGSEPQGSRLEDRVLAILDEGDYYEWDELVAALTDDVEQRLEDALQELQASGEVQHSGRHGGYTLV